MKEFKFIPIKHGGGALTDPKPQQKFEKPDNCILEFVQNAIDASKKNKEKNQLAKTTLRFHFKLIKKTDCNFLDKNFENHLSQRKYNRTQNLDESIPCLIMEDFNTTGITGDATIVDDQTKQGEKNNWYYFLIDFGGGSKLDDADKGGSEGEGRQTFMLNSGIATFFGLSIDSTNNNRPTIFGMSYFGARKVNEITYPVFSSFGKESNESGNKECVGVVNPEDSEEFISTFKLKRKISESGTSIVVPFYNQEEINKDFIIEKLVDIYRVPIVRDQLEVYVEDECINAENIRKYAYENEENVSKKHLFNNYYSFLENTQNIQEENKFELNYYDQKQVNKNDISDFDQLIEKYNKNETIKIRLNFQVNKLLEDSNSRTKTVGSYYEIFLEKYASHLDHLRENFNDFIRGPIPVYNRRNKRTSMFHLIDLQDKEATLLFKHAEQANHSDISSDNWKLKGKYKNYRNIILLSKKITTDLYSLISLEDTEDDFDSTQDLFKIEEEGNNPQADIEDDIEQNMENENGIGNEDEKNKEGNSENKNEVKNKNEVTKITHIIVPPIFPGLKKYEVSETNEKNGTITYKIKGVEYDADDIKLKILAAEKYIEESNKIDIAQYKTKDQTKQLELLQRTVLTYEKRIVEYKNFLIDNCTFYPRKIIIEAAYDTEGLSNPFKRYSPRDFDFNDEAFKLELDGNIKLSEKNENKLILLANEDKFSFKVNGFKEGIEDIRWKDRNYTL